MTKVSYTDLLAVAFDPNVKNAEQACERTGLGKVNFRQRLKGLMKDYPKPFEAHQEDLKRFFGHEKRVTQESITSVITQIITTQKTSKKG